MSLVGHPLGKFGGEFGEIAETFGEDVAMRILEAKGGCRVVIPSKDRLREDHWLVFAVGMGVAEQIADYFQVGGPSSGSKGIELILPLKPDTAKHKMIFDMIKSGYSANDIARQVGCTTRTVYRYRRKLKDGTLSKRISN